MFCLYYHGIKVLFQIIKNPHSVPRKIFKLVPGRILTFLLFKTLCKISRIVVFMFSTWNLLNPLFGTYLQKHKINIV